MYGPKILARTLTSSTRRDRYGNAWQYHSRSDHHSKVACWGVIFDLLATTPLLRRHVAGGAIRFGINHEMRDFVHDRKKNLDVVLCTPNGDPDQATLASLIRDYDIDLTREEREVFAELPTLARAPVGSVVMALEAKACMTAHQRALPRLYDELNSSHATVHGSNDQAIAVGFAMVNLAESYLSPDLNKRNRESGTGGEPPQTAPGRATRHRQDQAAPAALESRGRRIRCARDRRGRDGKRWDARSVGRRATGSTAG